MKKHFLLVIFTILIIDSFAQVQIGLKSGAGAYFDLMDFNILGPRSQLTGSTRSEFGNELPRHIDKQQLYMDFAHQHEVFVTHKKSIYKFGVGLVRRPRAYNDPLELFWGQKENQRLIHYTLTYGRKILDKEKWSVDLNSGLIVDKFFVTRTTYSYFKDSQGNFLIGNVGIHTSGREPGQYDWGFPLEANLNYNISKNASVGLQGRTFYLLQIGIEGAYLMPMLKISF